MNYPAMARIKATAARQSFGEVIRRAVVEGEQFMVEKNGLPVVVILSVRDYEGMRKAAAQQNSHD
jgi:prevent-host-death family protein